MTRPSPVELERLRQAFSSVSGPEMADDATVDADRIWLAVRGELSPAEIETLADEASRSPATAAAWRLAVELSRELDEENAGSVVRMERRPTLRWAVGLAVAAVVVIGVALPIYRSLAPAQAPTFRTPVRLEIASEVSTDRALPRDAFELRWTSAGEGSLYDIVLTDSGLVILDQASFLEEPTYTVSSAALSGLAPGDEVWWKVDATRPDGSLISSPTFVTTIK